MSDSKRWTINGKKQILSTRIFNINEMDCHLPSKNLDHTFYGIELRSWVNIFALTENDEVLLVRQHRLGGNAMTIEVPAGTIDSDDEDPKDAAMRELKEETGYVADDMVLMNKIMVNPAIQNNYCYFYFAKNCRYTGSTEFDETEDIELIKMPKDELFEKIYTNYIDNSLALQAVMFGKMYLEKNK